MGKKIWILNHYATGMFMNEGGRHYWFAENLLKQGYDPTIFCANTRHNSKKIINVGQGKYVKKESRGIPFIFVKTTPYNNIRQRIKNMLYFYKNVISAAKDYAKHNGKPDVILASSVHPLTLVAGLRIGKIFGVPCICEVRDLWPESIVAYGGLNRNSLIAKLLYQGEKWIYKKADAIIMTWEGGVDYIKNQRWDDKIDLRKIYHISNGVIINTFDKNGKNFVINDDDLDNRSYTKIVYAGSIRKVNNLGLLLDTAKVIQQKGIKSIKFIIYGSGDELATLIKRCETENIKNVIFKGQVEKKYIPSILKKSDINILHNSSTSLDKYGQSQNKLFEYLAAGKCIVQTYRTRYSILEKYKCGVSIQKQNPQMIANALIRTSSNDADMRIMGENARLAADNYDFKKLTKKLIGIIEYL